MYDVTRADCYTVTPMTWLHLVLGFLLRIGIAHTVPTYRMHNAVQYLLITVSLRYWSRIPPNLSARPARELNPLTRNQCIQ